MPLVNAARRIRIATLGLIGAALLAIGAPDGAQAAGVGDKGPVVTTILETDTPLVHGEYAWDDSGAPAGAPVRIVVDLATEKLHVYRGGVEIGRAFILYGADSKPTPTGTFKILQKKRDHISNLYNAPMPYMQRLTWGGVAIHGSVIDAGYATHGCIGVPDEFAAALFEVTKMGGEVLVTRNWLPQFYGADQQVAAAN
ncbi:L,D-transpeptidase family protein [Sphingomonas japonica]|uniref:Lipoprotein-anchoring transpeptidase ErfK/SrfK n=1 Tax=Sphingomonas japonica TaxID=511662 RepID=A0ABX0TZU8_9SPHN|nr:L,D-transpeptidase family protein [Sphingomonas japonica]NIJ22687.1 lipoprotein-anchoring transpeptidase ErfK/SrfK [Sphingomonas japonica]